MKKENNKGFLMFAHNNSEIDYFRLAVVNALLIQKNTGVKNIRQKIYKKSNKQFDCC